MALNVMGNWEGDVSIDLYNVLLAMCADVVCADSWTFSSLYNINSAIKYSFLSFCIFFYEESTTV